MRLVLDTNVVVSALLWGGTPRVLLDAAQEGQVDLVTSGPLLAELTEILSRHKFQQKIIASLLTVDEIVDGYATLTVSVRPEPIARTAPDPDDDVVLGTAAAAQADWIVSGDEHLLRMMSYRDISIVTASEAVRRIGQGTE